MANTKLGFVVGKLHSYLGHFASEKVLRAGHNFLHGKKKSLFEQEMEKLEKEKAAPPKDAPTPPAAEDTDKSKRRKQLDKQIDKAGG